MSSNRIIRVLTISVALVLLIILAIAILAQRSIPDLSLWHTVDLETEFEADDADEGFDWSRYLELEDRLFRELDERVVHDLNADTTIELKTAFTATAR